MEKFKFLKATRFWASIIGAVVLYSQTKGYIGEAEMQFVMSIVAVFIGVRTIDRFSEKIM